MNGRQLGDVVRGGRPGLRVLFITGFADAAVIGDRALGSGMRILTKPFSMEKLGMCVREIIG